MMYDRYRPVIRPILAAIACATLPVGCGALDPNPGTGDPAVDPSARTASTPSPDGSTLVRTATGGTMPLDKAKERAEALYDDKQYEAALREFVQIIADNPTFTPAHLGAGKIHLQRGDYAKAEKSFGQAATLEPSNFDAQYNHALTLQLMNRLNEAVRAYLRALSIRPDDFSANLNLASAYLQLNEPGQALPFAEKSVRLNGKSAEARTNLGAVYAALDKHAPAIVEYQQAAELTELSAPLLLNLADSLGKVGRYEEMVNTLRQLVENTPSAGAYERLGSGLFRLRQYAEAEENFRKSLDIDPNHFPALNGVGVCLLNRYVWSGHKDEPARDEAFKMLRKSLTLNPKQSRITDLLAKYR